MGTLAIVARARNGDYADDFVPFSLGKIDKHASFDRSDFRSIVPRFTAEARNADQALVDLAESAAALESATKRFLPPEVMGLGDQGLKLQSCPFYEVFKGAVRNVPLAVLPGSSSMCAGNTPEEALERISEVFERRAAVEWFPFGGVVTAISRAELGNLGVMRRYLARSG